MSPWREHPISAGRGYWRAQQVWGTVVLLQECGPEVSAQSQDLCKLFNHLKSVLRHAFLSVYQRSEFLDHPILESVPPSDGSFLGAREVPTWYGPKCWSSFKEHFRNSKNLEADSSGLCHPLAAWSEKALNQSGLQSPNLSNRNENNDYAWLLGRLNEVIIQGNLSTELSHDLSAR